MSLATSAEEEKKVRRRITNAAALNGHLNVLKHWRKKKETVFDKCTCEFAALGGSLEVLTWLRENDCQWNEYTCNAAAKGGRLNMLKYLYEKGCP
eukprot:CAMPEP_0197471462 /NCGR_PEP_ID=MMETSP1309-20131121/2420_1 /TAXON_ID=464262 /ORGANISM="Genus nov. species nov., Strain RCC998" /LENGTH=94 /DNA_ID=CAMNT_0043009227 /DNA_START=21 /DNA_END=301 /DNA_ORIENTATION=+